MTNGGSLNIDKNAILIMNKEKIKIAVIGQGYVGLPLAIRFGKKYNTIGFDTNENRISDLENGIDHTNEATLEQLSANPIIFSANLNDISDCNIYIVTVPTPIDEFKTRDLKPLRSTSTMLGKILNKGDTVVVRALYIHGCTEEVCVPLLEKESGLIFNLDFIVDILRE